jgi:ABC-type uncharacterized transport system ATPase component
VAVGSGKGGVGKSTLTLHLAGALRARGLRIAILDADFNGPSQARLAVGDRLVFRHVGKKSWIRCRMRTVAGRLAAGIDPAPERGHGAVERRVRPDMARDRAAAAGNCLLDDAERVGTDRTVDRGADVEMIGTINERTLSGVTRRTDADVEHECRPPGHFR